MEITPDFSEEVEMAEGEIPDGTYKVRVVDVELKDTKAGQKRLNWKLEIFGAEGDLSRYNNWKVFHSTMIQGPGAGMLRSFVKAATGEEPSVPFNTDQVLGREVLATLKTEKDQNGEPRKFPSVKAVKQLQA